METVEELIYFWTMSENRFNQGDRKKKWFQSFATRAKNGPNASKLD